MSNKQMTASTSVRIRMDDVKVFGPGIAELLERIDRCESIRTATMEMKIAYSKAWTILKQVEDALGFKLLLSTAGGQHGGGAVLTEQGEAMLSAYDAYSSAIEAESQQLFLKYFSSFLNSGFNSDENPAQN